MKKKYDRAKEEYNLEDEDGKHKLVYAYFGLAIYYGQSIEVTFSIMLWTDRIFKKRAKTNKEVNEIIDFLENSKKTMGNLINEVKQNYNIPKPLIDKFDNLLNRRNYLIHKNFKLHIEKFYSEIGQLEMIKYFCDFVDEIEEVDKELNNYYSKYTSKLGLTDERINEIMNEIKIQELKRTTV
jgi:hypothetical protein